MTPRDAWALRLRLAAPGLGWPSVRMLAALMASAPRQEQLLAIGDALAEAANEARGYGWDRDARDLGALAELVREQAGLLPARVWPAHI